MPAIDNTLRLKSSALLATCAGLNRTAEPATSTDATKHITNVTVMVYFAVCWLATRQSPFNIGLNDEVVDGWSKHVRKQNCQHHAFWISRVNHTNSDYHKANQSTENPLARICHRGRYRIGRHKEQTEGIST